jgi:hypothetical protein
MQNPKIVSPRGNCRNDSPQPLKQAEKMPRYSHHGEGPESMGLGKNTARTMWSIVSDKVVVGRWTEEYRGIATNDARNQDAARRGKLGLAEEVTVDRRRSIT